MTPEEQKQLEELQAKDKAEADERARSAAALEAAAKKLEAEKAEAAKTSAELGGPLDESASSTKGPKDEPGAKHKAMSPEEIKEKGGGLKVGRPSIAGPAQDAWDREEAAMKTQREKENKLERLSPAEIKKMGGGGIPGKPTIAGPALDAWNKEQAELAKAKAGR